MIKIVRKILKYLFIFLMVVYAIGFVIFISDGNYKTAGMNLLFSVLCFFGFKNQKEKIKETEEKKEVSSTKKEDKKKTE